MIQYDRIHFANKYFRPKKRFRVRDLRVNDVFKLYENSPWLIVRRINDMIIAKSENAKEGTGHSTALGKQSMQIVILHESTFDLQHRMKEVSG